jgi:tetratricopeptide (TPR) repeat protein
MRGAGNDTVLHRLLQVNTCLVQRKYEEALALLTRAAFLAPQNVSVYKLRAETYFRMGDFKSASIDFKKVLHIFDVQAQAKQALSNARSNSDTGEVAKAIAFINEQVTAIKVRLANMCNLQGALLLEQGDYEEACAFFTEALSYGTTSAAGLTLLHRAICNVRLESWAEALADLNRYFITEQREKVSSDAMLLWAKLHWKMGLEDDARQKFEMARAQTPLHPEVLRLAKVMQQESDEACRSLSFDLLAGNVSTASKALESMNSQSATRAGFVVGGGGGSNGGGTTDVRVILLRSIARRRQGRLIDALGEVEHALAMMQRALAKAPAGQTRAAGEQGRLESSMRQQLLVQRNALLSDLGARAAAEQSYPEAIALYDAAIRSARSDVSAQSGGGGAGVRGVANAVAVATQPDFLVRRGEVHATVGSLTDAFDDFFAAMMTERFNAQMLAETEGDPLPALSLGREPRHARIEYPWVDGQDGGAVAEAEAEDNAALPSSPASSSGVPPSLIGVSARTRVKLALVHEKVRALPPLATPHS